MHNLVKMHKQKNTIDNLNIKKGILLLIIGAIFFGFQFVIRMSVGILRDDIISKHNVSIVEFGNLTSIYYLGYSIMQIPIGIMLDRFNTKLVAIFFMFITIFGSLALFASNSWEVILIARFITGCGSAIGLLFCVKIANSFFSEEIRSSTINICVIFGLICAMFGGAPMKILSNNFGYTKTFFVFTLSGIFLIIALFFIRIPKDENIQENPRLSKVLRLIINPKILLMGICSGFMVGTFEGFSDVWGIMFFNKVFGFTENESISLTSLIFLGFAFGGFVVFFLQKFIKDNLLIFLSGLVTCAIYVFIIFDNNISYTTICFFMFIFGIMCQYQIIVLNFVSKIVDNQYKTLAVSIVNCINMMFGSFFHKIISYTMNMKWDGVLDELGRNIYSNEAIIYGIGTIPIFCFFGMLGFIYIGYKK